MIGVFKDGERIGSILYFVSHRGWVAYAKDSAGETFKTRKAAVAWLADRHEAASPISSQERRT